MKKKAIDIFYVWKNELKVVLKDPALILMFFIVPAFYPLLYSFVYNKEVVTEVRMVVVDDSHSSLSREFIRNVDASHDVSIIGHATDISQAQEALYRKEAYGILHIPSGFSKNINTGQQTQVKVFADMSGILHYKAMLLATTEASLKMGADIRVGEMGYKSQKEDEASMQFVQNEWVSFYNAPNGFAGFFIPAILILILQQTMLLGVATLTGTHVDRKNFTIVSRARQGKKIGSLTITLGKALCYFSLYPIICIWVLRIIPYLFNLPQIGNPFTLVVFLLPFLLSCSFFCLMLSYFCSQREFGMLIFAATSIMLILLSGISWPWNAMPGALKGIAYLFPSTPGIQGFVKINTMGADISGVRKELTALWVQTCVYWVGATLMYKWWLQNYTFRVREKRAIRVVTTNFS